MALESEQIAGLGFEQLIRFAPAAISVVDASGRIIHTNDRALELTDRQLGREMPADLDAAIDIFHPDGRRYERDEWPAVRSIAAGEEIVEEEFFYALPAGERLWMRCDSSPIRDKDGAIVAAVLVMAEVTERRHEEERLRHLAGLLDITDDAIVAFDAEWRFTVWNGGAERLYGWTADEVVGRDAVEIARLDMTREQRTEIRLATAREGRWRGEVVAYRKDGTSVWVEVVTVALHDARGQISGYLEVHRDVTARRRAEEALREAQAQRAAADRRLQEVREAERSRIARDLHDGALQGLTHALVVSDRHGPSRDDELFGILQRVGGQVRAAIYGLEEHGERAFSEALRELVEVNGEMTPACDVRLDADAGLPDGSFGSRGTEVLRIIGEALTNACRHAGAERIVVRVTGPATRLCVEVTDDGRGFRPTPALRGQGLRGMHERAELLAADLDIRSDPTGTTVRLVAALSSPG